MSTAAIIELADAIATDLNEYGFSKPFDARRRWLPIFDREQLTTIQVCIVPRGEVTVRSSRSQWQSDYRIEIGIQRHVKSDNQPEIDDLAYLSQEIFDRYDSTRPGTRKEALIGREWPNVISAENLDEGRVFASFQTLTFRGWRDL